MECNKLMQEALELLDGDIQIGNKLSGQTKKKLDRALNLSAKTGSYLPISRLDKVKRQEIADSLFSRNIETAKGLTSNQVSDDVNYFGTTTKMKPINFLKSAASRDELDTKELREDFASNIAKGLADGKIELGPPKLWLDIRDNKIVVTSHEGRHRSDAVMELLGDDINIPVDLQFTENGREFRGRYLDNEILNLPIISEDGKKLNGKLTTMYGLTGAILITNSNDSINSIK